MAGVTVPVEAPNAYANAEDLTNFWKAPDSETRANYLLKLASNRLRLIAEDSSIDLDDKANNSPAYFDTLQWVVMESTKRALQAPLDQQPVESFQQTAGPYSENLKYTNPTGDLWFKKSELSAIGLNGNPQLYSISTSRTDIYGS
jgi:hypothetical protein